MLDNKPKVRNHRAKVDYSLQHYYKKYVEENRNPVDYELYKEIINYLNNRVREKIATTGYCFKLPHGLGILEWRKYQRTIKADNFEATLDKMPVDRYLTRKLWNEDREFCEKKKLIVRHLNEETDRYIFRLLYFKSKTKFKNKGVYQMVVNQKLKRMAVKPIREGWFDAFLINSKKKLNNIRKRNAK